MPRPNNVLFLVDRLDSDMFQDTLEMFDEIDQSIDDAIILEEVYDFIQNELTPTQRKVLTLFFGVCGEMRMNITEIAKFFGLSKGNVHYHLKQAILKLRNRFANE